jgi:outer membrane protein
MFLGANSINAQTKVAHIDFQGLVSKMPEMTAAKAQLDKKSKEYDTEYTAMVTEYQTKMKKYEGDAATVTEAINETRAKEMQDMGQRIQQARDTFQKQLQEKESEIVKPIIEKAKAAIQKVGKAKGFQYVMDASTLILADGQDLFEEVKKELKF